MLVPRSYKYRSPPGDGHGSRASSPRRTMRSSTPTSAEHSPARSPAVSPQRRPRAEPVTIPSPKPAHVAAADERERERERARSRESTHMSTTQKAATISGGRSKRTTHDPNSLPPAVAALLAMTAIPPRRPNRYRTRPGHDSHVSIEELVSSWKSDDSLRSSYGSPGLSMLLEDGDDVDDCAELKKDGVEDEGYFNVRSSSSESMPSLEADDRSVLSFGSLSTPESLRSRRSMTNLRRSEKQRYVPAVEMCPVDHPLAAQSDEDEDDILHLPPRGRTPQPRKQSSFKSNLTLSLQSLKNAAISSISSLSRSAPSASSLRPTAPQIDDTLWSHPFLFPRLSSEVRPALDIKNTRTQRQYLNPMPLTFEEQEAPFQKALHAPYLKEISEDDNDAPTIQMQTYNRRGSRKLRRGGNHPVDPKSEAGRALLGAEGGRQREVRENSDFLRIVVMEMNMRRVGKLESGRAKIWLPPREATVIAVSSAASSLGERKVPRRWVGVSAY